MVHKIETAYTIKRSYLDKLKRVYGAEGYTDEQFLQWWRRNYGTGYEKNIRITKG